MTEGFIYVLSNPALRDNLLKIGLTTICPERRAMQLGRSTSIPSRFELEHSVRVTDTALAEKRIHMVLRDHRYDVRKEFFTLSLADARLAVDTSQTLIDDYGTIAREMREHYALIIGEPNKPLSIEHHHLLNLAMAATKANDRILNRDPARRGIVDGFLSLSDVMELPCFRLKTRQRVRHYMRDFARKTTDYFRSVDEFAVLFDEKPNPLAAVRCQCFDRIEYYKGELAWRFSNHWWHLFATGGSDPDPVGIR